VDLTAKDDVVPVIPETADRSRPAGAAALAHARDHRCTALLESIADGLDRAGRRPTPRPGPQPASRPEAAPPKPRPSTTPTAAQEIRT
jgi:hypothetical protein